MTRPSLASVLGECGAEDCGESDAMNLNAVDVDWEPGTNEPITSLGFRFFPSSPSAAAPMNPPSKGTP